MKSSPSPENSVDLGGRDVHRDVLELSPALVLDVVPDGGIVILVDGGGRLQQAGRRVLNHRPAQGARGLLAGVGVHVRLTLQWVTFESSGLFTTNQAGLELLGTHLHLFQSVYFLLKFINICS